MNPMKQTAPQPQMKSGKMPITTKKNPFLESQSLNDVLYIDPELRAELDAQNLQPKWLDSQETFKNGGYDSEGWVVYKRKPKSDTIGLSDLMYGQDPTGIVRRGSLVLGVMDKERHAHLKEYLQIRSDRLTQNLNKKQADQLRQAAVQSQVEAKIHEGYEENE